MFFFIKFVHIIVAMIYFAMPFTFGRWYHSVNLTRDVEPRRYALGRMRFFCLLYLNASAFFLVVTGYWMSHVRGYWGVTWFPVVSLLLMLVTTLNINVFMVPLLRREEERVSDDPAWIKTTRRRLAVFSATHHTLVTILAALMVWKP